MEGSKFMRGADPKGYKGTGMEGWVARWYARTRRNDMEDFRRPAKSAAESLRSGCDVLEIAPGPGFFAIELAKLGDFRITGLDVSRTFVEIATANARNAGVTIDFRLGNAAAMPFAADSFDFIYCSAAFKNFSEPVKALDEMHRVLRAGGKALVADLRKDVSLDEIDRYLKKSGRGRLDAWMTKWAFRCVLINRAYTKNEFVQMAEQSSFGTCQVDVAPMGFEVRFTKPGA
jgi:ubiquinone/menaquinone biosynthesis C-methylase UbiE